MARTTKPLTDTEVRQLKVKEKEYVKGDGNGLYIRVKPNGAKHWIYQYPRPFSKKRNNLSLGSYPTTGLKDARERAQTLRKVLEKNIDPEFHREEERKKATKAQEQTFEAVFNDWLAVKEPHIRPSYRTRMVDAMTLHVLPTVGSVPISKLTAPFVIEALQPLKQKSILETVRKVCRWTNEVMTFAVNTGVIHSNPLSGIRHAFPNPTVKNRPSIKPSEMPELMQCLDQASITVETKCQIEWLLHTMARPIEGVTVEWTHINWENETWQAPAELMKMNRPHIVPLSRQCLEILKLMKSLSGHRKYVFPSAKHPNEHMNPETANMALRRMGYGGRLVAHGLRSLASTALNEHGFDAEMIEVSQARVDKNSVRAAYNRAEYIEKRRKMMQWWSDQIDEAARSTAVTTQ